MRQALFYIYILIAMAFVACGAQPLEEPSLEQDFSSVDSALTSVGGAIEDTYVRDGDYASTRFGQDPDLAVKSESRGFNRISFLKFNVPSGTVTSAKLRIHGWSNTSTIALGVYAVANTTWSENTLTWNNKAALGAELGAFTVNTNAGWYEVNVTPYVVAQRAAGASSVTLAINPKVVSGVIATLRSAESTTPPRLLIETTDAASLAISSPLSLGKTTVRPGEILTGSVTYRNTTSAPVSISEILIASRPPGGTRAGGPYADLVPVKGASTVAAGATVSLTASRTFTASDAQGTWEAYATYRDASGVWRDGPGVSFTVAPAAVVPPTVCQPTTCAAQGATCGAISNGCGGTLQCGTCPTSNTASLWVNATDPYYWLGGGGLFADLMKQSDEWRPSSGTVTQDSNGWITRLNAGQTATTYLVTDSSNYPTGTYTLMWEGKGTFSVSGAASFTVAATGAGQRTFEVTSSSPLIAVTVSAVDSSNYLKNIRVLLPGRASNYTINPWNQSFVDMMKNFGGIRFMDFHSTNYKSWQDSAELTQFTSRTPSTHRTMARGHAVGGAAYEYSIDLVNRLAVNGWWCIPHNANDDFVTRFGQLLRDGVNRDRKIYIELSNEIWNFGTFDQGDRMMEKGVALGLSQDTFQATLYYQSKRTKEVVALLKSVFGAEYSSRVRVVMASQAGQQWVHENLLSYNKAYEVVDALATAPYFGHDLSDPSVVNMTLDQAFTRLRSSLDHSISGMVKDATSARTYAVDYVAYEGGQHLAGNGDLQNNETLTKLFVAMNRDARMGQLYTTYYDAWKSNGGTIHPVFTNIGAATKYGSWGITEYVGQPRSTAPKYDAVLKWMAANPVWYAP
jgi:hypothetical protein